MWREISIEFHSGQIMATLLVIFLHNLQLPGERKPTTSGKSSSPIRAVKLIARNFPNDVLSEDCKESTLFCGH
ncbi:hypothetical protein Pint_22327 [Pistacia integerrima]|uniref:Uncharacterized protein n=1 Tax=Pistacia integerrima TaxID=434235 RepID=A0ACC0YM82_9ROSI|nr:hypothetical protein Pint_22327 [Pistacia integerrima]